MAKLRLPSSVVTPPTAAAATKAVASSPKVKEHGKKQKKSMIRHSKKKSDTHEASSSKWKELEAARTLLQDLQNDNLFFDSIVDMIPAKLYVPGHSEDGYNPKYFKGQAKESKEARRASNKQAKRAKLDPSQAETTTQTKKRVEQQHEETKDEEDPHLPQKRTMLPVNPAPRTPTSAAATTATTTTGTPPSSSNKSRIEALRDKLHAKIAEKRGQRPSDPNAVSKRAARRAEKKRRQEEATSKQQHQQNKKKAHSTAERAKHVSFTNSAADAATSDPSHDLERLDFGRLDGLNPTSTSKDTKQALAKLTKTKHLEKMLADAEKKRQRIDELKQQAKRGNEDHDEEDSSKKDAAKERLASIQWGDAIKEASGERVKDDPTKLKKTLKRKAAKKAKSAKAWKSRMDQTKSKMDERQKIRNHNLSKRKLGGAAGANLSKKRIVTEEEKKETNGKHPRKQQLRRPGFEGKKQEFLNDRTRGKKE